MKNNNLDKKKPKVRKKSKREILEFIRALGSLKGALYRSLKEAENDTKKEKPGREN